MSIFQDRLSTYCPNCSCRIAKGIYEKSNTLFYRILHYLYQLPEKWKCTNCKTYVPMNLILSSNHINNLLILHLCSSPTSYEGSAVPLHLLPGSFHLSDTKIHDIFTAFVDLPRLKLPEFLSVDEVHIDISENKYFKASGKKYTVTEKKRGNYKVKNN